jgi:hypothetical protein
MNREASRMTLLGAGVLAGKQCHGRQVVGFQFLPVDLAGDEELVDLDMLVAARETLCAGGRSEQHHVFAWAEIRKPDLSQDAAGLAAHPAAWRGIDEIGVYGGKRSVVRPISSVPARELPTTSLATVASTSGSILYGIVRG